MIKLVFTLWNMEPWLQLVTVSRKNLFFILHALKEQFEGNEYSAFSSQLIKHARVINESVFLKE